MTLNSFLSSKAHNIFSICFFGDVLNYLKRKENPLCIKYNWWNTKIILGNDKSKCDKYSRGCREGAWIANERLNKFRPKLLVGKSLTVLFLTCRYLSSPY